MLVNIEMEERKGGASENDCQRRCDRIMLELQNDAERAGRGKAYKEKSTCTALRVGAQSKTCVQKAIFKRQQTPKGSSLAELPTINTFRCLSFGPTHMPLYAGALVSESRVASSSAANRAYCNQYGRDRSNARI
jgi:hypothetical protein